MALHMHTHQPQADMEAPVQPPQVNGGTIAEKVEFGYSMFEKAVSVDSVFQTNEMIDTIAITKGGGTEGVVTRWGVTRLPRKTHRGLRKVCPLYCRFGEAASLGTDPRGEEGGSDCLSRRSACTEVLRG
jgi:ribosomal protein L3